MKLLIRLGMILQQWRRGELLAVLVRKALQHVAVLGGPDGVDQAERPAEERREANAKHRANVAFDRGGDHAVLQGEDGFVDETRHQSVLDFFFRELGFALDVFLDDLQGFGVELLGTLFFLAVGRVQVEPFPSFAPQELGLEKLNLFPCMTRK